MAPRIIISYDDLAYSGATLSLAYVVHDQESGAAERRRAEERLEHGARLIGAPDLPRHVVFNASTGEGLLELATREHADVVVFGSDYRTAAGAVIPQTSAQRLLTGGSVAVAIAPADFRSRSSVSIAHIGVLEEDDDDDAAKVTARTLASALGASVEDDDDERVDLLVVGSRKGAPTGRVELSATAGYAIDTATSPVLVVPSGKPVLFAAPDRSAV